MNITLPKRIDGQAPPTLNGRRQITVVGANGTGKTRFINQMKPSEIQKLFKEIPADYLMRLLEAQAKVGEGNETLIITEELQ